MTRPLQLPTVTTTRIDISPGQEIGIQDFLRGLKRPRSKLITVPAAHDKLSLVATAVADHSVSVLSKALPNRTFGEQNEAVTSSMSADSYAGPTDEVMKAPKVVRTLCFLLYLPPIRTQSRVLTHVSRGFTPQTCLKTHSSYPAESKLMPESCRYLYKEGKHCDSSSGEATRHLTPFLFSKSPPVSRAACWGPERRARTIKISY